MTGSISFIICVCNAPSSTHKGFHQNISSHLSLNTLYFTLHVNIFMRLEINRKKKIFENIFMLCCYPLPSHSITQALAKWSNLLRSSWLQCSIFKALLSKFPFMLIWVGTKKNHFSKWNERIIDIMFFKNHGYYWNLYEVITSLQVDHQKTWILTHSVIYTVQLSTRKT